MTGMGCTLGWRPI